MGNFRRRLARVYVSGHKYLQIIAIKITISIASFDLRQVQLRDQGFDPAKVRLFETGNPWDFPHLKIWGNCVGGSFFPNSVSLGSSAIPGTGSQEQVHKQDSQGRSEARFPSKVPGTGSQARLPETIPKQGSQEQVPRQGSQARVPGTVAKQGTQESKVPGNRVQARFLGRGFQEKVAKKVSKTRFASKGFPGKIPGNRFPSKVRKTRFPSKVRKNRFTSKGSKNSASSSKARVPRTGFHAR